MNAPEISNLLNSNSLTIFLFVCRFGRENKKNKTEKLYYFPYDLILLCFLCLPFPSLLSSFYKVMLTYRLYIHQLAAHFNMLLGYRYLEIQEHSLYLILLLRKPGQLWNFPLGIMTTNWKEI